jgi:phage tail sheath gpL-like
LALEVNLKAGSASPGSAPKKGLLMALKGATGTITADTELVESVAGEEAVGLLLDVGTDGHLFAKRLFEEYGLAQLDVVSPGDGGGTAATQTLTFASGPPTVDWTVKLWIAGRKIEFLWKVGETDTVAAARAAGLVGSNTNDLPVSAAGALGVCTFTHKLKGPIGNDVRLRVEMTGGTTGTATLGGANMTGGATEQDIATALTTVVGKEYDLIGLVCSSDDAEDGSASSNPGKLAADIESRNQGFSAKLQQAVVGINSALSDVKTGTGALNDETTQYIYCLNGESVGAEYAGAEMGARLKAEGEDPAVNRIEEEYQAQLFGAADLSADEPTDPEVEDALNTGITIITYTDSGKLRPSRPITTYHKDANGDPDDRVLDTSVVTGSYAVAKDLRVNLPREFKGAKLSADLAAGEDAPPAGVVQERDVKGFVITRLRFFANAGVIKGDKLDEAIANGSLIVQVDATDDSQINIVIPLTVFPPLAKMSVVVQHRAN